MQLKTNNGQHRYLPTSSVSTAFTLMEDAPPVMRITEYGASHRVIPLGSHRGVAIKFFGSGADDSTFNYRVFRVLRPVNQDRLTVIDDEIECVIADTSTATLSGIVGDGASSMVGLAERYADTVTATISTATTVPPGAATQKSLAYLLGDIKVVSPGATTVDKGPGELIIPDLYGAYGIVIDFDLGTATGANALIELTP